MIFHAVTRSKATPRRRTALRVASLFSGAGGLDLGFKRAGMRIVWANEYDKSIWETFESNFPTTELDKRSIVDIDAGDLPAIDGMIGGPPCQSWSEAGARRGIRDSRGQLFFEYERILAETDPLFFLAENVSGILFPKNRRAFSNILEGFCKLGYNVSFGLLNANDYGVPQDRERVIIVGYRSDTKLHFEPPTRVTERPTLKDAIWDLRDSAKPARNGSDAEPELANHHFLTGGYSTIYMSRNRVRQWHQPSFTIQAGGRHAPLHPQAPVMELVGTDVRQFVRGAEHLYRRLTVRECARVQTFPDDFTFVYRNVNDGYKMVGNAVPVELARRLGRCISKDLSELRVRQRRKRLRGTVRRFGENNLF
jgi:DNA (cytosine-5)-methyltransferase 1